MNISSISPRRWAALLLTVLLMLSLTPAALADTDENTPRITVWSSSFARTPVSFPSLW